MKRNCIIFNLSRELFLIALCLIMVFGVCCAPECGAPHFFRELIVSKAIGIGA